MKISKWLAVALAAAASTASMADVVLSEGFDDVATLAGKGWAISNQSSPVGVSSWFQGNPVSGSYNGAAGSHIGANFLNTDPDGGTISNWLFTPVINLAGGARLDFALRLLGEGFLDTVQVYYSLAGSSTNIADFSLLSTYASDVDTGWAIKSENLDFLWSPNAVRFAFRYTVADVLTAGNYVGIDAVNVNSIPEPVSAALVGVGLLGAAAARRRAR